LLKKIRFVNGHKIIAQICSIDAMFTRGKLYFLTTSIFTENVSSVATHIYIIKDARAKLLIFWRTESYHFFLF